MMGEETANWPETSTSDSTLAERAKDQGYELVYKAKEKSSDLMDQVQDQLQSRLSQEKSAASTTLGHIATAVQQSGQRLREQEQTVLGQYADSAAGAVENFSNYLRDTDLNDVVRDVENVARKRPAVFIGGLFVVGLMAGRFLKSSGHRLATGPTTPNPDPLLPMPVYSSGSSAQALPGMRSNHDGTAADGPGL